jgi:hypothetical protein
MQSAEKCPPKLVQEDHKKGSINPGKQSAGQNTHREEVRARFGPQEGTHGWSNA